MDYKICSKGVWDTTIPGITFDENGVSNYCKMQESLMTQYPKGEKGVKDWTTIVDKMKKDGKGKKYDCVIGISGGTDSSYLLHISKIYGLRVLAVNLDNGWSSDFAVKNIKAITTALDYDLETYVIDYDEVKTVLRSYVLARLPWVDSPTDIAIKSIMYKVATRENIKYTLNGGDFRSEGKQPLTWTYSDTKQLKYVVRRFSMSRIKTYPTLSLVKWVYYGLVRNIKTVRPLYFLPYEKKTAKELLEKRYGWIDYGGHHHENVFTKFIISYWLPVKFGIDKRIITYSAQVLSGEMTRDEALTLLKRPSYNAQKIEEDIAYVLKKLDLSREAFTEAFTAKNKFYYDYPSYYPFIIRFSRIGKIITNRIFGFKPGIFEAMDQKIFL